MTFTQLTDYINTALGSEEDNQFTVDFREGLAHAVTEAQENGVRAPSAIVGTLLSTLAAAATSQHVSQGAVVVTPAAGVAGLHILRGLSPKASLTCIEPEVALQAGSKEAFLQAGYRGSRIRFLTSRPLDVMGRLATSSYHLVYADVSPMELTAFIDATWPLLTPGGTLILADALLDGTVADHTRRDRDTEAAREADAYLEKLALKHDAIVARLPLDGGLTLLTKR